MRSFPIGWSALSFVIRDEIGVFPRSYNDL